MRRVELMHSPAKRARDTAVDSQLFSLARSSGIVFRDRELLAQVLELIRLRVPAKNIIAVAQKVADARNLSTAIAPDTGRR